ncbi:S26 family signal peptidase [Kitasatospora sp. NPDC054939]
MGGPLLLGLPLPATVVLPALVRRPAPLVWLLVLLPLSWMTLATARALLRGRWVVVTVRGASMQPTLRAGDRLLVRRGPVRAVGDIAVLGRAVMGPDEPAYFEWIIKRVAAMPGDAVPHGSVPPSAVAPGGTVPPGMLVLLGDNPTQSFDSRRFGYYAAAEVLGVVVRPLGRSARRRRSPEPHHHREPRRLPGRLRRHPRPVTGSNANSCRSDAGLHDS